MDARTRRGEQTRHRILDATRALLVEHGQDLTLAAIAKRLGVTKQAVLYHYSTKEAVLVELGMRAYEAEADCAVAAVARARGPKAIKAYAEALLSFYLEDLERFRLLYLRAQMYKNTLEWFPTEEREKRLYPTTGRMYGAVEQAMKRGKLRRGTDTRATVVAVHMAVIGIATMYGLTNDEGDAMVQPIETYLAAMVNAWMRGVSP